MKQSVTRFLILLCIPSMLFGQVIQQDSLTLVSLYTNTNGPGWTNRTNWNSASAVGTWYGVTVSAGRVTSLDLSNNQLSGNLPDAIGNLTGLTSLQLYGNALNGSVPDTLGNLTNLTSLGLENNQFSGTIPSAIGKLSILIELNLFNNQFTDSIPGSFQLLTNLQKLNLQSNRLIDLPNLSNLSSLNELKVENNRLTFEDIEPNIGGPNSVFTYSPQDSVGAYNDTTVNEAVQLIMVVTAGGVNNQYQWKKNGVPLTGAQQSTFTIDSVKLGDAGTYTCDVTNTVATSLTLRRRTIRITITGTAPGVPGSLTATTASPTQINLGWNASSGVKTRYRIFRSADGTNFSQIDSVSNVTTSYSSTGLNSKTQYHYRVMAVGNFGNSGFSNSANATTSSFVPRIVRSIPDTSVQQGFVRFYYRLLRSVFTDDDDATLNYSAQADSARVNAIVSNDSLYLSADAGFAHQSRVIVTAADADSSVADTFLLSVNSDTQLPVISNITALSSTGENTVIDVSCQVTDNIGVLGVELFYSEGNGSFASVAMSAAGNQFSAQIPAAAVTRNGVAYFIAATDTKSNVKRSDTASVTVTYAGSVSSADVSGAAYAGGMPNLRWRLLSVPADLDNKNIGALFPGLSRDQWAAYNESGTEVSTIANGRGVWFKHKIGSDTMLVRMGSGRSNATSDFSITLRPGWNIIGNPYLFTIPVALDQSLFYGPIQYNGSSVEAAGWSGVVTTLNPFGGYALYNRSSTNTIIVMRPTGISLSKKFEIQPSFRLRISARTEKNQILYGDEYNYFSKIVTNNPDTYNAPEPETVGDNISVYFEQSGKRLTQMYRSSGDGDVVDVFVRSTLKNVPIQLNFNIENNDQNDIVMIFDITRNRIVDGSAVEFVPTESGVSMFKVIVGRKNFVGEKFLETISELPKEFSLKQNYPNPFNPTTQIRYAIPKQGRVSLKVYNVLGHEVRTLEDGFKETGVYDKTWDGKDILGRSAASGIYVYRLEYLSLDGKHLTQSKKMLLLK
ncbi:fibronectin type III domain-containing protein [bacterium]|nr:fibronectin type III domain-containing protein [bacterium]